MHAEPVCCLHAPAFLQSRLENRLGPQVSHAVFAVPDQSGSCNSESQVSQFEVSNLTG